MASRVCEMKRIFAIVFALVMMMSLCACGTDEIDVSSYADQTIVLSGLKDKPIEISIAELAALECKTVTTESTSDKIGEVKATGVELGVLLANYGYEKADFAKVIFKGADQYDVKLLNDYIVEHDMILAYGIDGEPLDEESAPCRLIIPRSDSAYWIRMINEIDFVK